MKILVCIKQIPDTSDVRWTKDNNILREGVISILNPSDIYALLAAKSIQNADVTVLTMGPSASKNSIKRAFCYAGNRGILLSDKRFSGADTLATAKTLYWTIKNYIKEFDIILTGQFAQDGDTGQTPYSLANLLNIPNIGYVNKINYINENEISVTSVKDSGIYQYKGKFPILLSFSKFDGKDYIPLAKDYIRAQEIKIETINADVIGANLDEIGIKGSPTYVYKAFKPQNNRVCKFIEPCELIGEIK